MRLRQAVLLGCLLPVLVSCTTTQQTPLPAATGQAYSCCDAADINRDYRPGQTLTVQWTVGPGAGSPSVGFELNARLTGPYATVVDLKAATAPGAMTFTAQPLHPTGGAGETPVSVIAIPPTAAPGYYNLITSVSWPSGTASGASVVHVVSTASTGST